MQMELYNFVVKCALILGYLDQHCGLHHLRHQFKEFLVDLCCVCVLIIFQILLNLSQNLNVFHEFSVGQTR